MYFFTADEHYGHGKIIKFTNRPFSSVEEMDAEIIKRFNSKILPQDVTVHAGDFAWKNEKEYITKLNGTHIFLRGSHDHWLPVGAKYIYRKRIENQLIVVCHYAMRTWEASHYNSWQLFGHSHGWLEPIGKQHDIGVDNNDFFPLSFEEVKQIMMIRPDNPNLVKETG